MASGQNVTANPKWARLISWAMMISTLTLVAALLFYRFYKEKPFFPPRFTNIDSHESWRSGQSDRRCSSSLAQAPGILWIVMAQDRLQAGPQFPFNFAPGGRAP